ncbi:MAG: FAD/NAD(P)-binding oxidoreductase [Candidatus Omnitrophica bacterium]|nr:FAD/NAD(P)-binding oxidoreductase [Candidatus Omnitrophota bacterium]MDD5670954.1 FAD/NAD(P)-binding oxidoreductase [Candidatus Omnitrophota bacterium]
MARDNYNFVIVGGGLAGDSAIEGIREMNTAGSILLISKEDSLPYDRPPLTKKLWFGKKHVDDIFLHDLAFYYAHHLDLKLGITAMRIDPSRKIVADNTGNAYHYDKLLLATGGEPRRLTIPGGALDGICYYRTLDDYEATRTRAAHGKSAVIIGGGFIGSEMAAALCVNGLEVTMIFPEDSLCQLVFPATLSLAVQAHFIERGVRILAGDKPALFSRQGQRFLTRTEKGVEITSDIVIAGIGIQPETALAATAQLEIKNGIVVNEYLQTSNSDIYAAGDNAFFPSKALGKRVRMEHWDNALNQGKQAGRNMAGAAKPYDYLPYFFSDLFEFGYEAVGEVDARLKTVTDWQEENRKGVIYYLIEDRIRGVMLCNVWGKLDMARELILKNASISEAQLCGTIR